MIRDLFALQSAFSLWLVVDAVRRHAPGFQKRRDRGWARKARKLLGQLKVTADEGPQNICT
jgi:hypothetical protein